MNGFAKGVGVLLVVCAAILAMCGIVDDSTPAEPQPEPTYTLNLDCSNNALMHRYGMPTKSDVMEWHVHGQWGYFEGKTLVAYDELPGDSRAWDALYGIGSDNPAFDK